MSTSTNSSIPNWLSAFPQRSGSLLALLAVLVLPFAGCDSGGGPPEPEISGLQPDSGPPETMLTINGTGFGEDSSAVSVTVGGSSAPVNSVSSSSIETEIPSSLETGPAPVEVTVGDRTATGPDFTVEQAAPGISSVSPDSGTVGTEVTIKGKNFSTTASENTITFNGTDAPVNGAATDQLKTEVPSGATDGPIEVTVDQKTTTGPDFDVITEGTMEVVTTTSGDDQDDDGYTVTIDGTESASVGVEDTSYFAGLEDGAHDAELSGAASNCSVQGDNPRSVDVSAGDTTSTTFEVQCDAQAQNEIVFGSDRDGDYEIFRMNADGSDPRKLTDNTEVDRFATLSSDGTQIAFISTRDGDANLYVMNADGSGVTQLTSSSSSTLYPTWSPDGTIVYQDGQSGDYNLYSIHPDGTGLEQITSTSADDQTPSVSPDGSRLAFTSNRNGSGYDLYTMNLDGSDLTRLTNDTTSTAARPEWSPDGSKIAYYSDREGNFEIYTMNSDGTGRRRITNNSADDLWPSWSPDGSELVFFTDRDGNNEVYKVNADGSGTPVNLTADPASDGYPHWSPVQ